MISQRLEQLELYLEQTMATSKTLQVAESTCPEYYHDRDLRIQFLRAENFVAKQAARRMICFLEFKKSLFGENELGKKITLRDLHPEDIVALRKGFLQILPSRDQTGRMIVVLFPNHQEYTTAESLVSILPGQHRYLVFICFGSRYFIPFFNISLGPLVHVHNGGTRQGCVW